MDELVVAGLDVTAMDLPGLGLSSKPARNYTWSFLADRIADTVRQLGLKDIHLVLHDIAGPVGVEFAVRYPQYVHSMTIANTFLDLTAFRPPFPMNLFTTPYLRDAAFSLLTSPLTQPLAYVVFRLFGSSEISYADCKAHSALLRLNNGRQSFFSIMANFNLTQEHTVFLREGLKKLARNGVKLQAVWVSDDTIPHPRQQLDYVMEHFSPAHIHILNSRHLPQEDQPAEFAQRVLSFVKSVYPAQAFQPPQQHPPDHHLSMQDQPIPHSHLFAHSHEGHDHAHHGHSHSHGHGHSHGHDHAHHHEHNSFGAAMPHHHAHGHAH